MNQYIFKPSGQVFLNGILISRQNLPEMWKPCYSDNEYECSTYGNIRHRDFKKNRNLSTSGMGYQCLVLKNKSICIHKELALTWLPNPHNKALVDHRNENKNDNHITNLQWVTKAENKHLYHLREYGLAENFLLKIKELQKSPKDDQKEVIQKLAINYQVDISRIKKISKWKINYERDPMIEKLSEKARTVFAPEVIADIVFHENKMEQYEIMYSNIFKMKSLDSTSATKITPIAIVEKKQQIAVNKTSNPKQIIAEEIRKLRISNGWSQTALALMLPGRRDNETLHATTVSKYESGKHVPEEKAWKELLNLGLPEHLDSLRKKIKDAEVAKKKEQESKIHYLPATPI